MHNRIKWGIHFVLSITFFSCNNTEPPIEIKDAFTKAGSNKKELMKVTRHFGSDIKDSLKLKAAIFLIANMDGWFYYKDEKLDQYFEYLKIMNRDRKLSQYTLQPGEEHIFSSFKDIYGPLNLSNLERRYDLKEVKANDMIENINLAFKVWQEQPWGKDIDFDQFCEQILPFRIDNETPEYNRQKIFEEFNPVLDSARKAGVDAMTACLILNNRLIKDGWRFTNRAGFLPHFPISKILNYRTGSCRDMADAAVYIMRSVGIPVGIDFVPQWPYQRQGHGWNFISDMKGKVIGFMGAEQSPGISLYNAGQKKGKVYRRTYAINSESLVMQTEQDDAIPSFLMSPRIKDVTDQYVKCFNISVPIRDNQLETNKYAYLSVFDNVKWVPIHWGKIEKGRVEFFKMEGDIVYLPVYFDAKGVEAANYPLILSAKGKVHFLKPDNQHLNNVMILTHIYPVTPDMFPLKTVVGGRFEAASKLDFSDGQILSVISKPMPFENIIPLNLNSSFRYIRYLPPTGQQCKVAELGFYRSGMKLKGKLIGTEESYKKDTIASIYTIDKAVDDDESTFFRSKYSTGTWLGFDFGSQQKIDEIRFYPARYERKDLEILSDDKYELFYWENNTWVSKGVSTAKGAKVVFKRVPSNALYKLLNHSRKANARIFTYEDGKQVWW